MLLKSSDGVPPGVAIQASAASVITVTAVLCARETRGSSLRHDRVVRDAHQ